MISGGGADALSNPLLGATRRYRPAGFTLVEALVSITLTAIAASVLLAGIQSTMATTEDALDRTIAQGLATQLMDEVVGQRYHEAGASPYQTTLCPNASELQGSGRSLYDDIDDYHGYRSQPPTDRWGKLLGQGDGQGGLRPAGFRLPSDYFALWRQEVDVYYVDPNDFSRRLTVVRESDRPSYRAVEVRIVRDDPQRGAIVLAQTRRVVAYVSPGL